MCILTHSSFKKLLAVEYLKNAHSEIKARDERYMIEMIKFELAEVTCNCIFKQESLFNHHSNKQLTSNCYIAMLVVALFPLKAQSTIISDWLWFTTTVTTGEKETINQI